MAYEITGIDTCGALNAARADTYRAALAAAQGWTNVAVRVAREPRADIDYGPEQADDQVAKSLLRAFPTAVYHAIATSDAYGALVYRIRQACQRFDVGPADVLDKLADDDMGFAATRAEDPAAFLAARVHELDVV